METLWFKCDDPECEMIWGCERSGSLVVDITCPACQGHEYSDLGQSRVDVPNANFNGNEGV